MTGSPCAAQTVLKEGPSPEARRPSGTTCCVSLHVCSSLITGASELKEKEPGKLRSLGESEKPSSRLLETMRKCARLTGPTVSGVLKPQACATTESQGPSISSQVPLPSMPALAQPLGSSSHP
ncbi:hypothetical protein MJG53_017053 [Ovis ammon polii x Ovis aries]|uniref:Uncharacterized protein n=1 Tax=Ovis ammon polii x Ovis aries TaxID=2918886 RepID=A0ACB9UAF7_9CETA|nr:hypothetical protein MJG53_017053 [Ovis ammon polii x Ovis aries]